MKKESVITFFDRLAKNWDADQPRDEKKLNFILDCAKITKGTNVLDVACGTGILIPYYLERNVRKITAVDISPEMIKIARSKYKDPRINFINADIEETFDAKENYDACVVYNALPHFPDFGRLVFRLSCYLRTGGNLTIAHGLSRERLNHHHEAEAADVSQELVPSGELAKLFEPYFKVTTIVSDNEKYIVSGEKY